MIRCLEVLEILLETFEPVFPAKNGYPDLRKIWRSNSAGVAEFLLNLFPRVALCVPKPV